MKKVHVIRQRERSLSWLPFHHPLSPGPSQTELLRDIRWPPLNLVKSAQGVETATARAAAQPVGWLHNILDTILIKY